MPPSYKDSKQKLIDDMLATWGSGSQQFDLAKAILEVKGQEEIAKQTRNLTKATWILAFATVGLVIATIFLIIFTKSL
jgi:hypothetical protein